MKTAAWKPLFWEPVAGTSERIMAGAVVEYDGVISAHRLLRDDVLDCLYGKSSANPKRLLDTAIDTIMELAKVSGIPETHGPILGIQTGDFRITEAENIQDALRQVALLYSSLSNLDKIDEIGAEDAPSQEENNKRFITEVRDIVIARRPELSSFFNRTAKFFDDGEPVRFGFISPKAAIHYGVLHPIRQPSSVRDARSRLWELARAQEYAGIKNSALILATPYLDDATLGPKQKDGIRRNTIEIEREADSVSIRLRTVNTAEEGAIQTEAMAA